MWAERVAERDTIKLRARVSGRRYEASIMYLGEASIGLCFASALLPPKALVLPVRVTLPEARAEFWKKKSLLLLLLGYLMPPPLAALFRNRFLAAAAKGLLIAGSTAAGLVRTGLREVVTGSLRGGMPLVLLSRRAFSFSFSFSL